MAIQKRLTQLKKARDLFEKGRINIDQKNEFEKTGMVKIFELCYELSWRLLKHVLAAKGIEEAYPKDIFRRAAEGGLIDDPELWFEFQKDRNFAAYVYDEEQADAIINDFGTFSIALNKLITTVEQIHD